METQNNQQGVVTNPNQINKFLSVQKPVGESVVRFKENFAVPLSPSNPYYSLFFHPSFDGFQESIANETDNQRRFQELMDSEVSKIENIKARQMRAKNLADAKQKLGKTQKIADQDLEVAMTAIKQKYENAKEEVNQDCENTKNTAFGILKADKEKVALQFKFSKALPYMPTRYLRIGDSAGGTKRTVTNEELREIYIYTGHSLEGFKINNRRYGYHSTSSTVGPLNLTDDEYINKVEYRNHHRSSLNKRVAGYVKFTTDNAKVLVGGKTTNADGYTDRLYTYSNIRVRRIYEVKYTGGVMSSFCISFIPSYHAEYAKAKNKFIEDNTVSDKDQYDSKVEAAEMHKQVEYQEINEVYESDIEKATLQRDEIYKLADNQYDSDCEAADKQFVKDNEAAVKQTFMFLSQTTAVVLDERINGWYRQYQQITDKEQHFRGLVDAYKYELDSRNKERFAEGVVLTEESHSGQYNQSKYLNEIFSKTQKKAEDSEDAQESKDSENAQESKDAQVAVSKSLFELEAEYTQYRNILYQIRDMKSELLREIRLAGYDLTEIDSDVAVGKKIQELGYHFVITKGEPEYKDVVMADYEKIFDTFGVKKMDNSVVYNILVNNKAPKKLSEDELNSLKGFFENEGYWGKTVEKLNEAFETMPQELKHKFIEQKSRLKKDSDEKIPHSLWAEKETEKSLEEAQKKNLINDKSWLAERKAKKEQLELDSSKGFPNAKKVLENLLEQVKNIQHHSRYAFKYSHEEKTDKILQNLHWEAVDTFFDLFQKSCDSDGALVVGGDKKTSLKFEFYSGQGMNSTVQHTVNGGNRALTGALAGGVFGGATGAVGGFFIGQQFHSSRTINIDYTVAEPFLRIRIVNKIPDKVKQEWTGEDYIFVIKNGDGFTVKSGSWDGETKKNIESSQRHDAIKVFYDFFESCQTFCDLMSKWSAEEKNRLAEEETVYVKQKEINDKVLENIQKYALTKARLQFLLKWKSPGRFGGYMKISNPIMPDTDPWVEFVNQLKPQDGIKAPGKYNPMSRKVKIDHFSFSRNGYYTQNGLSMHAYLQLIARDDRSKAMRVAIFPVLDSEGSTIPSLRRAVINPERSFEPNPIRTLHKIRFIEQNKTTITWDGMCLGELSHTENLMPGESKTITIEKQTRLKEKLSFAFENEVIASAKDTVSFEEKLSQEINNEETSEEEIMREAEKKQEKSNTQKETILDEHKDTRKEVSKTSAEANASYGPFGGSADHSKDITKTSEQLNRNTQENENAVKDSKKLIERNLSKQGRKSQQKNLSERINKTASETSKTNKTSIKKASEQESESMDKRLETIEISNQNVGKTLNYYFFQLQNIYKTITETENVKIVINPGHEIIAKSGISDVRDLILFWRYF